MKNIFTALSILISTLSASAFAQSSVLGGNKLNRDHVHHVGAGWPSVFYEYWMSAGGSMDWAVGGEFVYGDYVGYQSDVDLGFGINVPMKWHLNSFRNGDLALKFNPGFLIADAGQTVFGIRAEIGMPVSLRVHRNVNLITGGAIPFTIIIPDSGSSIKYIPFYGRIGAEFNIARNIVPTVLLEMGPVIATGGGNSDTGFGVRFSASALLF